MEKIKKVIEGMIKLDSQLILEILKEVCENGDVMIIKSDGLRDNLKYSVVISSSQNKFLPIRYDADDLNEAILNSIKKYYEGYFGNIYNDNVSN